MKDQTHMILKRNRTLYLYICIYIYIYIYIHIYLVICSSFVDLLFIYCLFIIPRERRGMSLVLHGEDRPPHVGDGHQRRP